MADRNPPRLPLGASALAALAIAGCGAAGNPPRASLHATAEKRLLGLIAEARADASKHDGPAVQTTLSQFIAQVDSLRASGQLSAATARSLTRRARATGTEASIRLHSSAASLVSQTTTTAQGASTSGAPATGSGIQGQPTKPAKQPAAPPGEHVPPGHQDGHGGHGWWSGGKHHGGDHGAHGPAPTPPASGGGDAQGPGNPPAAQGGGDG